MIKAPYWAEWSGEFQEMEEAETRLLVVVPVALGLIFLFLFMAFRSLLDAGAKMAFGSDWSVAPLDPLTGIDAALNRRTLDGKHPEGWFPEQKITVAQAIDGYTMGSAYDGFQEHERGSLTPGKLADFVVLSRDILEPAERDHIAETTVLTTVVGGKVVYEKRD